MFSDDWAKAIDDYLDVQRAGGSPSTTLGSRRQHLQHLARRVDAAGPWAVTADQLVQYASKQVWMPETRRGRRSSFRSFYGWAVAVGRVDENISLALPRVKAQQGKARPIPDRLYKAALAFADDRVSLILRLAHDAGLRRGEIAVIHTHDVFEDLDGWSLLVHGKGGKERYVPLTNRLALDLRTLPIGWAFPGDEAGHLSARWVGKLATKALPEPWTIHTLRHSFASRTYVESDLFVVQELLGHASPATTRIYVKVPNAALRRAVLAAAS
ncbi:tyrosine-type recombinase/integrase [Glaciibacter psychrotolerans]|uniref:Site-specific recombinase XerD n=1 Tax=Glaciibacter psychrotolerans TaxID=670054 RepID=A0A7Z0EGH3_9MICO|nr:tyrosine-type recombinase/integrase [Leifsonia psychrotolerans]NYJ20800.1 site-specific recombinase XerD [Leifsonia psychrotolerans]